MELFESVPSLSPREAIELLQEVWGITADDAVPLPSERDQNFRVVIDGSATYVLKIANGTEDPEFLAAQQAVWEHTSDNPITPNLVQTREAAATTAVAGAGVQTHVALLLTWLDGLPLADRGHRPPDLLQSLGESVSYTHLTLPTTSRV